MNFIIFRALFEDARQQVLDNKVFRLLLILTAIPIVLTFVLGFHEESITLFWGWKEIDYKDIMEIFSAGGQSTAEDMAAQSIRFLQEFTLDAVVGRIGIMLCIAATAFFAPKILEKGSADTLFSKPVSRIAILLSRYFAGILFVAFISSLLVTGMYLGFLINSGFNDPGFLWGALTLVYLYAMMHAFSMVVAVFTRSSTAAILLTITLYMFCGGIHTGWTSLEFFTQKQHVAMLRIADNSDDEDEVEEAGELIQFLTSSLRFFHYVLPKTSDADLITNKLKRALTEKPPAIQTSDGEFLMKLPPADFSLVADTKGKFEDTGVEWSAEGKTHLGADSMRIRRYERPKQERKVGSKTRIRSQTGNETAKQKMEELQATGASPESEDRKLSGVRTTQVTWLESDGDTKHRMYFFHFDDWIYEFELIGSVAQLDSHEASQLRRNTLDRGNIILGDITGKTPGTWYSDIFSLTAEWKYNIFFSIGSSLAFIVSMLTLAWLRLRKIDF